MKSELEREIERTYQEFFEQAERRRRWNVFHDVPWSDLEQRRASAERALVAETFCAIELFLPDYVASGMNLVRKSFGQAWFQANWAYEESKHALCLREWLMRAGHRTRDELEALEQTLFEQRWELPFDSPRRMTAYGLIQETTALVSYRKEHEAAEREGDRVLSRIYQLIARDEAAHASFYLDVFRLLLAEDRPGALADLGHVFANFEMPAASLIPGYAERLESVRGGGFNREQFLSSVWFPVLRKLGVTRSELRTARVRSLSVAS